MRKSIDKAVNERVEEFARPCRRESGNGGMGGRGNVLPQCIQNEKTNY